MLLYILFFAACGALAYGHVLAMEYFLYWRYLWLDIPMHVLGGFVIALGIALLPSVRATYARLGSPFALTLGTVLLVGVGWEVFEVWAGLSLFESGFWGDTLSDLAADLVGGAIGYLLVVRMMR